MNNVSARIEQPDTQNYPPIVLYNRQPAQFAVAAPKTDSFELASRKEKPIVIDPNDKFVLTHSEEDEQPQQLVGEHMLGAKFNPKTVKNAGKEAWKWAGRIWTAAEIYDTIDGYKERFSKNKNKDIES